MELQLRILSLFTQIRAKLLLELFTQIRAKLPLPL